MKTDVQLQQQVKQNICNEVYLNGDEITVKVLQGTVILWGNVSAPFKILLAEKAAYRVWGVLDIQDNLRVKRLDAPDRLNDKPTSSLN